MASVTMPLLKPAGEGDVLEVGGDLFTFKGRDGDGIGSLFIELVCPPGGGPPAHTDPSEELFYVLEGDFEFLVPGAEGTSYRASAGDSFIVPKRAPHTYRNVGGGNGRMIVFFRDGEHMQPFFEELGDPVEDPGSWTSSWPPSLERAMAAAQRHGIEPVLPEGEVGQ